MILRWWQDLRFAVRALRKNAMFSTVAIATFALGIGANTAIFSVVSAVLLRPLPYPQSEQILQVSLAWKNGALNNALTVPEFEFYRDHSSAFQAMAGFRGGSRAPDSTAWVIRAGANPALGTALRRAIAAVNPDQRVMDLQPMSDVVAHSVARPTFNAMLMGAFAALALALTSVGIYGLLSFQVAQRTQEIGIRMALGAKRGKVLLMVVGQGAFLAAIGIGLGVAGAAALARFLSSLLSGVRTDDPLAYALVSVLLLFIVMLASYLPARRASKVDPLLALRHE